MRNTVMTLNNFPGLLETAHDGLFCLPVIFDPRVTVLGSISKSCILFNQSLMLSFELGDDLLRTVKELLVITLKFLFFALQLLTVYLQLLLILNLF